MFVSSDYVMRMCGLVDGKRLTDDKNKTNEQLTGLVLRRSGKHQTFLDISRCLLLGARFLNRTVPSCCPNLLYLDISYTSCDDLASVYLHCPALRTLNASGLQLMDATLNGIEELTELEVLSIRGSNIRDISALAEAVLMRSLDLGNTTIDVVTNAFDSKERLEELLLDGCQTAFVDEIILAMSFMKRLKLVNLHEGVFAMKRSSIARTMEWPVHYEPYARR
jgi:Leucine-rich repeat (LRR) protein